MRKLLSLTLAILMVFALVPFSAKADLVDNDFKETLKAKLSLMDSINDAKNEADSAKISADGSEYSKDEKWVKQDVVDTLNAAIGAAEGVYEDQSKTKTEVEQAKATLDDAITAFNGKKMPGTKVDAPAPAPGTTSSRDALGASIFKAEQVLAETKTSTDGKDVSVKDMWATEADKQSLQKAIDSAKAVYKMDPVTDYKLTSEKDLLDLSRGNFEYRRQYGLKDIPTPNPSPNPTPEVKPQGYVTLTIYRNLNNGDYEYTVKSYAKGTYLYNVNPYGRVGYRVNGYSYSPNGSLINEYTKVEDLAYTTIYANWGYIGEDYYGYGYHRPNSLIYAMDKAKSFKRDYPFQIANVASSALKAEFDAAYTAVSNMYDNSYWGYYYGYYNDGRVYYRNGRWLTYNEYVARYGTYDMENYRRYDYDGRYDGYYRDLYERNGRLYSYNEYRNNFGRYPYDSERVTNRRGYWDAYYGWGGYGYEYYGSNYKAKIERLIDAIRAIARQYPGQPIYNDYANLAYPTYSSDYYYGYDYYGKNYTGELKSLINKAEALRDRIKGYTTYEILTNLQSCIDDAYKALQGRANYSNAYENLKNAINRADNTDDSIYIRRSYMTGDPSGKFGPYETLTRAQVAQIVANLLKQSGKTTVYNPKQYKDVEGFRWYKEAVDLVTSYGIMTGTPGGLFEPNKLVSKAELVVTAARLRNYQPTVGNVFGLTSHYWAQGYIQTAVKNGWLDAKKGFVPDAPITRGETAHIFNGALGYVADQNYIIKFAPQMKRFSDVERGVDYYYDIMTATNTVSYKHVLGGISWLSHIRPEGMWTMNQYSTGKTIVPLN